MDKKKQLASELEESPADEQGESSAEQSKENKEGTEIHDSEGVLVPEKFQHAVHEVLKGAKTKHHLQHVRDRVNHMEDEMHKKETKSSKDKPASFSVEGMPE